MKIVITEATINTVMNACQNLADTGTEEAARKVLDLLDLLYGQNLLEKSTYKDLTEATKVQHETGDYMHRFGGLNYMQTVTSYMSFERDWQRNRPLYSYPLPFGKAHAIRRCITDLMNGDNAKWASFSEMHDTLYLYNIVESSILEKLHKLALKVYYGEYQGTYEELRDKVYEITGTDG